MLEIVFHPYYFAPLVLLALAFLPAKSKASSGLNILSVGLYVYVLYAALPWPDFGSFYLRYVFGLAFVLACAKPVLRFGKLPISTKFLWWSLLPRFGVALTLVFYVFLVIKGAYPSASQAIELSFPLKSGTYYVGVGGSSKILNYHIALEPVMHEALDISKMGADGRITKGGSMEPNSNSVHLIYRDSVYSPCDGIVQSVVRSAPDHAPGEKKNFALLQANVVAIGRGDSVIVLAHFLQHSIVVEAGDSVLRGEFLGLVGNSGHSSGPHLHIHATLGYRPLPLRFDGRYLTKNSLVVSD